MCPDEVQPFKASWNEISKMKRGLTRIAVIVLTIFSVYSRMVFSQTQHPRPKIDPPLEVPFYYQGTSEWCWACSTAMLLKYYGKDVEPWTVGVAFNKGPDDLLRMYSEGLGEICGWLNENYGNSDEDYDIWRFKRFRSIYGDSAQKIQDRVIELLNEDCPVVFYATKIDHIMVARGYDGLADDNHVIVCNPGKQAGYLPEPCLEISWKEFRSLVNPTTFSEILYADPDIPFPLVPDTRPGTIFFPHKPELGQESVLSARRFLSPTRGITLTWEGRNGHPGYIYSIDNDLGGEDSYNDHDVLGLAAKNTDILYLRPFVANTTTTPIQVRAKLFIKKSGSIKPDIEQDYTEIETIGPNDIRQILFWVDPISMCSLESLCYASIILEGRDESSNVFVEWDQIEFSFFVETLAEENFELRVRSEPISGIQIVGTSFGTTPYDSSQCSAVRLEVRDRHVQKDEIGYDFARWVVNGELQPEGLTSTDLVIQQDTIAVAVYEREKLYVRDDETIQAAIDAAHDGDTIVVRNGTYTGPGNKNLDFKGKAITLRSENGPEKCIIDCEGEGNGVSFASGEERDSVIEGITIANGSRGISCFRASPTIRSCDITNMNGSYGGGIYCEAASPLLTDCVITGNVVKGNGGGVCCYKNSSPLIKNCLISLNSSRKLGDPRLSARGGFGGGFYFHNSSPRIMGCVLTGNSANYGGGIVCVKSSSVIADCVINHNLASTRAGGIFCDRSTVKINNCLITRNEAGLEFAGGILARTESSLDITSCTITNNKASPRPKSVSKEPPHPTWGGGIYCNFSSATITDSILWGNSASEGAEIAAQRNSSVAMSYSNIKRGKLGARIVPGCTNEWDASNIAENPLFVAGPQGDFYLSQSAAGQLADSPCVDAGSEDAVSLGLDSYTTRIDEVGDTGVVDMGFHYAYKE